MFRTRLTRSALACLSALLTIGGLAACSTPLPPSDPESVAAEAFVFGAPLVTTVRTMQTAAQLTPANQLTWQPGLAGPQSRLSVAPNRDTVYVGAPIDLRSGPFVLTVPAITDRYFSFQFLDAYMENDAYVGTRTNGGTAGTYLIAPPGYIGAVPTGMQRISMRTLQMFLIGRIAVRGPEDVAAVMQYRDRITLAPLPGGPGAPPPPPAAFGAPRGAPQALVASGLAFFDELGADMALNPPTTIAAKRLAERMAKVGLGPGFTPTQADAKRRAAFAAGLAKGAARVDAAAAQAGDQRDGWSVNAKVGSFGNDFLLRAVVSRIGWGANAPEEATYAFARVDADGQPLDGARSYSLTFPKGATPPTNAFWSIAAYDADLYFRANQYDRYSVSSTEALVPNADGSITLTFSRVAPSAITPNWVPVPEGQFVLMFRNYLPTPAAIAGPYHPPALRRS